MDHEVSLSREANLYLQIPISSQGEVLLNTLQQTESTNAQFCLSFEACNTLGARLELLDFNFGCQLLHAQQDAY